MKSLIFIGLITSCAISTWYVLNGTNSSLIVLASIADAVSLFSLKKLNSSIYGLGEILIGLIAIVDASTQGRGAFDSGFSAGFDIGSWKIVLLQTAAAIYIFISGLENSFPCLRRCWSRLSRHP